MMSRIRSIKPEWLDDEKMSAMSDSARLLSVALILLADDYGRGRAGHAYLAGQVWAAVKDGSRRLAAALRELAAGRFVGLYEVDGQSYYEIRNWKKHQRIDNAGKPRVPAPSDVSPQSAANRGEIPQSAAPISDPDPDPDPDPDHDPVSAETAKPSSAAIALTFPTDGAPRSWNLTTKQVSAWSALYPKLDILQEARTALSWIDAAPERRKTARGMKRFLVGWFGRSTNRLGGRDRPTSVTASEAPSKYRDYTNIREDGTLPGE